jgi:hypothetical protein
MNGNVVLTLTACLLLCVGCGQNVTVIGKVTFEDDGSPLSQGMVIFQSGSVQSKAPIEADGSYQVGTLKTGDGIPRGTYQVYITGAVESGKISPTGAVLAPPIELVDPKFTSPETSGLSCDVKGRMTFDITVTPPNKK